MLRFPVLFLAFAWAACAPRAAAPEAPGERQDSEAAQTLFRDLRQKWFAKRASGRASLGPELRAFLVRFPEDRRSDSVRAYLAWLALDLGEIGEAEQRLKSIGDPGTGPLRDLVTTLRAGIQTRKGDPERAIVLLEPLRGKFVDSDEQLLYGQERVRATLAARRWEEAALSLEDWLTQAPLDTAEPVRRIASEFIARIPATDLERCLDALEQRGARGGDRAQVSARQWLQRTLLQRLTNVALERRDAKLARKLYEQLPPAQRSSERGVELARLASENLEPAQTAGRALGLVLDIGSLQGRRHSASAALGISKQLQTSTHPPRFLVRDDQGTAAGFTLALTELVAAGVSILVAGTTPESAALAAEFADRNKIPVITLAAPERGQNSFLFVLGTEPAAERAKLHAEFARLKLEHIGQIGAEEEASCRWSNVAGAGPSKNTLDAVSIETGLACAQKLVREVSQQSSLTSGSSSPLVGLALESSPLLADDSLHYPLLGLSAGRYPSSKLEPNGASPANDWYEVLGHDAAVLVQAALANSAPNGATTASAGAERRERTADALRSVTAPLWSTSQRGFGGAQRMPRTLTVTSKNLERAP